MFKELRGSVPNYESGKEENKEMHDYRMPTDNLESKIYCDFLKLIEDVAESVDTALSKINNLEHFISVNKIGNSEFNRSTFYNDEGNSDVFEMESNLNETGHESNLSESINSGEHPCSRIGNTSGGENGSPILNIDNKNQMDINNFRTLESFQADTHYPNHEVYVDNLFNDVTSGEIISAFNDIGFKGVQVSVKNRPTHSFAFVKFNCEEDMYKAVGLNRYIAVRGRYIGIRMTGPPRPHPKKFEREEDLKKILRDRRREKYQLRRQKQFTKKFEGKKQKKNSR